MRLKLHTASDSENHYPCFSSRYSPTFFRSGNSLYELLDIPKNSTQEDIKKKYRRLALKYVGELPRQNSVVDPQVSPWQESRQCRGRGDVQKDQQCQRNSQVSIERKFGNSSGLTHFLSDEKKRQLYDEYGSFGLYLADQVRWLWLSSA